MSGLLGAGKEGFQVAVSSLTLGTLHEAILAFSMQERMDTFWQAVCQNARWLIPAQRMCILLGCGEERFRVEGRFAKGRFQKEQGDEYAPTNEELRAALCKISVQWFSDPVERFGNTEDELLSWLFADNPEMLFVLPIRTKGGVLGAMLFVMQPISPADQAMLNTLGTILALHAGQTHTLIGVTEERRQMQDQLLMQEKMASLGNLVAGVAHEVNNPIGAINSAADVSARGIAVLDQALETSQNLQEFKDDRKVQRALQVLRANNAVTHTAGQRIAKLVQSLKNFARLDEAEFKLVDLHEGIDSTLTLVDHELKNRVEVEKSYGTLPPIKCFPNQLNQVFMNLFINAAQATADRGVLSIKTWATEQAVHIAISDTGKGMDSEQQKRIFDPGFTTKGVGVGTGLGLSISYNIIKKHQGTISVKSQSGQGSTFTIALPLDPSTI